MNKHQVQVPVQQSLMYYGPLPTSKEFSGYEQASPGAGNRILAMAEKEAEHRQINDSKIIEHSIKKSGRGQLFAFALALALVSSGLIFFSIFKGEPLGAIAPAIMALSSLVAVFAGKRQQ